jgi:hypothetical protein
VEREARSRVVVAALGALLIGLACERRPALFERSDAASPVPSAAREKESPRAWPLPGPGRGVAVGPIASADALRVVSGAEARSAVPDRCPDHDECVRIANNGADVAHASCDRECARCCPHDGAEDCMFRECAGACKRCADDACRKTVCNDAWLDGCRRRCAAEAHACAGCRDVWCGDGAAKRACHADALAGHEATLAACERDCPAGERKNDGSCTIQCGSAKKTGCSKQAKECPLGKSPDCRCECNAATLGACVGWDATCVCD